ncbi:MAG TPA: ATP-dependent DNA helicase RecG, partial [Terrimicrobiaceae bacterium]|nr:ATP-dependent DNA helicase RecG [Terrimicrobiaceae bacterium]
MPGSPVAPMNFSLLQPETPLTEWEEIPRSRLAPLARLGLSTVGDLIRHYPRRYEDRRRFDRFPDAEMDRPVCLFGVVTKTALKRIGGWRRMFEITLEDESAGILGQPLTCRWFNMPYMHKLIVVGQHLVVFGRPKEKGSKIVIDHPEFEAVEEQEETSIHMNRITPVYPAGDGVSPRVLRALIYQALEQTDLAALPRLSAACSPEVLRTIHFPETFDGLDTARRKLVREEFLAIQLLLQARRADWRRLSGTAKIAKGELFAGLLETLPFSLTASQTEVIEEIRHDLSAATRMNRLLQGDVGSGKTLVALAAILHAVESGWQAALMAPTQILAEQHYLNFKKLLEPLGIPIALRTAGRNTDSAPLPLFANQEDRGAYASRIVIGTHALLYESSGFDDLGLIVIDEQHKFGVLQRTRLIARGDAPDVLVMTATPIPRTLTQTLYGDLDVSILREKPTHRGEVITAVRDTSKLPEVIDFVRKQIARGRQAYIVYPLVEDSEKLVAKSATAEFEKWKSQLAPSAVGLLHGRMSPDEKEEVVSRFRAGAVAALIATTVIEVGVDVPNATLMVVENAERFGLAQLHQLRGRIGRGEHKAFCILLHDAKAEETAAEKLAILEKTSDGFAIAEADLRLRGPGDMLGTAQTGLPPLKLGDLFKDAELMRESITLAASIFAEDPE